MGDDTQKVYKTIMTQEDRDRDLPIAEKYLSGKRIEWEATDLHPDVLSYQ